MIPFKYLVNADNYSFLHENMKNRKAGDMFEKFIYLYNNIKNLPTFDELEKIAKLMTLEEINNPKDDISEMLSAYISLPNITHDKVPFGASDKDNEIVKSSARRIAKSSKDYKEIGTEFGIFSPEINERIADIGFPFLFGVGPKLERALIELMLEHHMDYGYEEISVPTVTHERTILAAGSFPKHQEDAYRIEGTHLYLNPTIEMQQTSLIAERNFKYNELPLKVVGFARSFRKEPDCEIDLYTRVHEFGKVEFFTVCTEDQWEEMLLLQSNMLEHLLDKLGLMWRKLLLCTGDTGQAGCFIYDYEIYAPGSDKWLEISSLSYRDTYQAVKLNATYTDIDGSKKYVHTYNTPGFAVPRVFCTLLECMYQDDGKLKLPECLVGRAGLSAVISKNDFHSKLTNIQI